MPKRARNLEYTETNIICFSQNHNPDLRNLKVPTNAQFYYCVFQSSLVPTCFGLTAIIRELKSTWGDPKKTRLVSMPPNAEEWEKDNVSACSLDPQLSVARWTSSCNNSISRTVSFREGSFCDPVEIVMCDLKEQGTCLKFCFLLGKTPTESLEMLQEAFKEQALSCA